MLRPIHMIRSGLTRLGRGEFGVTLDLPPGDEFGELGTFFNTVSRQLSADRSQLAGQKANLESLVEHLEDAVALFNPAGELLFTQSGDAVDVAARERSGSRSARCSRRDHAYRTLIEETLASRRSRGPVQIDEDQLAIAHAIAGPDGELVGILLVVAQPRLRVSHAVDDRLLAQARGAGPADCRHRPRGEEPAQRDDDSPRAAADEDPQELRWCPRVAAGCSPIPRRRTRACSST